MVKSITSLTGTLALDARFAHLYRPLIRNLIVIFATTVVIAAAALIFFDRELVHSLSRRLILSNTSAAIAELESIFEVADRGIRIAQPQTQLLDIGTEEPDTLFWVLEPFLAETEILDSINVADSSGSEFAIIKQPGEFLTRHIVGAEPNVAHWRRRVDGEVVETWERHTDVSPLQRPWYLGALDQEPGKHHWTDPYAFLTTKEPGISVSSRRPLADGDGELVIAFNLNLLGISKYTTELRPSEHGITVIFTDRGQTIGLPPVPRFADRPSMLAGVLSPIGELGVPALDAALATWEKESKATGIFRYMADQSPWWVGFESVELDPEMKIWSAVLIPEADFLGSLARQRNWWLAGIGLVAAALTAAVLATSLRSIRRQMRAAVDEAEQRYGQYQLKQKIGEGGNGSVYRAQHCLLRRPTAIKLMNPEFMQSRACRERFEHEVQITSNLSHPNTIAIYDYGQTPDGKLYYAMELLNGSTLEQVVACSGPMPPARVIHVLDQMTGSLSEAHSKGLIHRDIKPSNAILCERGGLFDVVKVLDFGLVKEIEHTDDNLTRANVLVGTPQYMAPELIRGTDPGSPRSDIYAVGAAGYFLLTGRNVFEGTSTVEICAKHLSEAPVPPSQRVGLPIPSDLESIILSCLEKNPELRPASVDELRAALLACRDAGQWTQQDAREWWRINQAAFLGGTAAEEATPLANTELLIDLDERLDSAGSVRREPV